MSDNTITSVFGYKGSGKSTLAAAIAREHSRVATIDTLGEHAGEPVFGLDACLARLERAEGERRFRLSLRCSSLDDMLDLVGVCYELTDVLIVVEETSFFCSPSHLPDELSQLVRYGRHRRIDQLYISRRPAEIHRDLTAQSDVIVSFAQREPRDLDYLARIAGADVSRLRTLPPFKVLAWGNRAKFPLAVWEQLDASAVSAATVLDSDAGEA